MNWILIIVTSVSASQAGESVGISTAEFTSEYSCQQAGRRAEQLVAEASLLSAPSRRVRWDCMPKSEKPSS